MSRILILGALEEEVLHLIGHVIDLHLQVLLLHLEYLPLVLELAHILLLLKYVDLLLLQELVECFGSLLVVYLLLLQLPQFISQLT